MGPLGRPSIEIGSMTPRKNMLGVARKVVADWDYQYSYANVLSSAGLFQGQIFLYVGTVHGP